MNLRYSLILVLILALREIVFSLPSQSLGLTAITKNLLNKGDLDPARSQRLTQLLSRRSNESQPKGVADKYINFLADLHPNKIVQRLRRQIENASEPPSEWTEHWWEHKINLKRVYLNKSNRVVVYFDNYPNPEPSRVYNFISLVWEYMTKTYGNFGPDTYLYAVLHLTTYGGCHHGYSIDPKNIHDGRNVLDCGPQNGVPWTTSDNKQRDGLMDMLTNYLGAFVESSSKDRWGSPSSNVWRLSAWRNAWIEIFTYDVYIGLKMPTQANRYLAEKLIKSDNNPRPNTFWFKDWFLPIWTQFGRTRVLNRYFELLYEYYPTDPNDNKTYTGKLNMGEFVHFWSGAAGHNLTDFADLAFGWNTTYKNQIKSAIRTYPEVLDLYNGTTAKHESSTATPNDMSEKEPDAGSHGPHESKGEETIGAFVLGTIVAVPVISIVVIISIAYVIIYKRKIRTLRMEIKSLSNQDVDEFFDGDPNVNPDGACALVQALPFVTDFEIPRDQIILAQDKGIIGTGQFGNVIHGIVRLTNTDKTVGVALKMVKPNLEIDYFKAFLSEVKIMAYLGRHENIVELVGTCTDNIKNREIFIALEFCPYGNLHDYLNKNRNIFHNGESANSSRTNNIYTPQVKTKEGYSGQTSITKVGTEIDGKKITTKDLLRWSQEIANAMMYIASKKVIHGDLAARNILLTGNRVAKVSDFGLSRQFLNYANYMKTSKTPVPWRWLAIETLKEMQFSVASDVWAFGVTMWEIFSLGETPYGAWTYDLFFVDRLNSGDRLLKPSNASHQIYGLLHTCWNKEPTKRPSFQEIHKTLGEYISKPVQLSFNAPGKVNLGMSNKPRLPPKTIGIQRPT